MFTYTYIYIYIIMIITTMLYIYIYICVYIFVGNAEYIMKGLSLQEGGDLRSDARAQQPEGAEYYTII